jgi:uncharacterized membrane protein YdjX (TVP38/TMEM64 family)
MLMLAAGRGFLIRVRKIEVIERRSGWSVIILLRCSYTVDRIAICCVAALVSMKFNGLGFKEIQWWIDRPATATGEQ